MSTAEFAPINKPQNDGYDHLSGLIMEWHVCLRMLHLTLAVFLGLWGLSYGAPPVPPGARQVIVVDPGHGGHENGARGLNGTLEKQAALKLAEMLKKELSRDYAIMLTRGGDYWVDPFERVALANQHQALMLISLHAGAGFSRQASGIDIWYYKAPDVSRGVTASLMAEPNENSPMLWDRLQLPHVSASRRLANLLQQQFNRHLPAWACRVQGAPLMNLTGADMPAVLIETGYLSNPSDEKKLNDRAQLQLLVQAIVEAIRSFLEQNP